ncbi:hypothetical protein J32TS6_30180 [Virgibacillus pantothenticus]|jgi:hypothetical protein|nr:hypothetical protein J32TS6_30180 [Virgibacillus pantothenticus]SIS97735.1 hypothetical protein SAMN05421787_108187 [Virgibacillus pantothenticus]
MTVELGIIVAVLGLLVSYFAYQLKKSKSIKTDSRDSAEVRAELGLYTKRC